MAERATGGEANTYSYDTEELCFSIKTTETDLKLS